MTEVKQVSVASVTKKILLQLSNQRETSAGKAILAKLRHAVGKPINEAKEIWPILFEHLPEEFLGQHGRASKEEVAILTAIQLYALHQQGNSQKVLADDFQHNIGAALRTLRKDGDTVAVDRRFNTMITATTAEELVYHLRHLITLLKSKAPSIKVNYAGLAQDLYWFMRDYQKNLRLNWARDYYKRAFKEDTDHDN